MNKYLKIINFVKKNKNLVKCLNQIEDEKNLDCIPKELAVIKTCLKAVLNSDISLITKSVKLKWPNIFNHISDVHHFLNDIFVCIDMFLMEKTVFGENEELKINKYDDWIYEFKKSYFELKNIDLNKTHKKRLKKLCVSINESKFLSKSDRKFLTDEIIKTKSDESLLEEILCVVCSIALYKLKFDRINKLVSIFIDSLNGIALSFEETLQMFSSLVDRRPYLNEKIFVFSLLVQKVLSDKPNDEWFDNLENYLGEKCTFGFVLEKWLFNYVIPSFEGSHLEAGLKYTKSVTPSPMWEMVDTFGDLNKPLQDVVTEYVKTKKMSEFKSEDQKLLFALLLPASIYIDQWVTPLKDEMIKKAWRARILNYIPTIEGK